MIKTKNLELATFIVTAVDGIKVETEKFNFPDRPVVFYVFRDLSQEDFNDISNDYYNSLCHKFMTNRRRLLNMMYDDNKG